MNVTLFQNNHAYSPSNCSNITKISTKITIRPFNIQLVQYESGHLQVQVILFLVWILIHGQ